MSPFYTDLLIAAIRGGEVSAQEILALYEGPKVELVGRSGKWTAMREYWLISNPRCAICNGTESLQVHHKMPYHIKPELELDPNNLLTLCEKPSRNCHFTWGHLYNWSNYNARIDECVAFWAEIREGVSR